jgi:DNA-binding transcriptional regulator YdaS (Cro superfamily)
MNTPKKKKQRILQAYRERGTKSAIGRIFGVSRNPLSQWLKKRGREAKPLADQVAPAEEGDVLELDEYWTYVRQRSNKRWLWGALCRRTRQIVAFVIGPLGEDLRAALGKNSIGVSRKIELQ